MKRYPLAWLCLALVVALPAAHGKEPYGFGVIMQRSAVLTAEYWNPILGWLGRKSGLALKLKMGKTGEESSAMIHRAELDFVYSNHNFAPENDGAGYYVIARPREPAIRGQIVVLEDSKVTAVEQLDGQEVAFPHRQAFVGYYVTLDGLLRAGVKVKPVFAGNQEGAIGQLRTGRAAAASVNSLVMRDYAEREQCKYRVLWSSEEYLNIPISAHNRVPRQDVAALRQALLAMADDPEGARILAASAQLLKQPPPYGFVPATDQDYANVHRVYHSPLVRER